MRKEKLESEGLLGPFQCPFCSGTFSVNDPSEASVTPVILHSVPTCKEYDAIETLKDATRYMRHARLQEYN